jgi:hypothetical protein
LLCERTAENLFERSGKAVGSQRATSPGGFANAIGEHRIVDVSRQGVTPGSGRPAGRPFVESDQIVRIDPGEMRARTGPRPEFRVFHKVSSHGVELEVTQRRPGVSRVKRA